MKFPDGGGQKQKNNSTVKKSFVSGLSKKQPSDGEISEHPIIRNAVETNFKHILKGKQKNKIIVIAFNRRF